MGDVAKLHADLQALVGETIHGRYEVETLLGAGGMGAVFKAQHTGLQRGVAIKVLHPEIGRDQAVSKRFDREAQSASRLDHPNCVRVSDFGTTDNGTKYLVMELLEGSELAAHLGQPWAPDAAIATIRQVLEGLDHAHHVGVVHRDLKPENIFIARDIKGHEVVKIVDFGIAKLIDEQGSEKLTRQGVVFGTPRYMSPEQAAGGKIDERTDLYAVGLILYELLVGHGPFLTDDAAQLLRMQIMAPPPPLPDSVPEGLAKIVDKLLEKSKADRFASAREVLDALAQIDAAAVGVPAAAFVDPAASAADPTTEVAPASLGAPVLAAANASGSAAVGVGGAGEPSGSGAAWQPAPPPPAAISGATVAGSAADLAAVSLSGYASGSMPNAGGAYGSSAGASGAHGSSAGASYGDLPTIVPTSVPPRRPTWVPFALVSAVALLLMAGIGLAMSAGEHDDAELEDAAPPDPAPPDPARAAAAPEASGTPEPKTTPRVDSGPEPEDPDEPEGVDADDDDDEPASAGSKPRRATPARDKLAPTPTPTPTPEDPPPDSDGGQGEGAADKHSKDMGEDNDDDDDDDKADDDDDKAAEPKAKGKGKGKDKPKGKGKDKK